MIVKGVDEDDTIFGIDVQQALTPRSLGTR